MTYFVNIINNFSILAFFSLEGVKMGCFELWDGGNILRNTIQIGIKFMETSNLSPIFSPIITRRSIVFYHLTFPY